jgi:hypothetical protein
LTNKRRYAAKNIPSVHKHFSRKISHPSEKEIIENLKFVIMEVKAYKRNR